MQVFKTFLKVLKKNMGMSFMYIAIFMTISFMMSGTASKDNAFEASKLDIMIADIDNSEASRALASYISENHNIVDTETDNDKVLDSLYYRTLDIVVTITGDYSERLSKGETEGLIETKSIEGTYSQAYFENELNLYIGTVSAYIKGGAEISQSLEKAQTAMHTETQVNMVSFDEESSTGFSDDIAFYFQYLAYILISIMITSLCPTLLTMTDREIGRRTSCSCMTLTSRMLQLTAGTSVYTLIVFAVVFIGAAVMFSDELFTQYGMLALLNAFSYLLVSMAVTLLVAIFAPGKAAVSMIANVLGLGMSFLCGVFVPQNMLGETVTNIGRFLPAYWFVRGNNMLAGLCGEIYHTDDFMVCIGIQLAFAAALLCVTLLVSKTKQTSKSVA